MATPGLFARLPSELNCQILARLPLSQVIAYYERDLRWRPVIDACGPIFARIREAVYIPLETLLAWPWTRHLKYVLTDFPSDRSRWNEYLEALKDRPMLAIRPSKKVDIMEIKGRLDPLPGTKRFIIGEEYLGRQLFFAVERYGETKIELDALTPLSGLRLSVLGPEQHLVSGIYTVLNPEAYEMFAHVDLGLVDPLSPPGPNNPNLRDELTAFWTYVTADDLALFYLMAYLGNMAIARNEEGNWIWAAPYLLRMGVPVHKREDFLYIPPQRFARVNAYLQSFGVDSPELGRFIVLGGENPGFLSVRMFKTVLDVMGAELPLPMPGERLQDSISSDAALISDAFVYEDNEEVYLVDGRKVSTRGF